MEMAGYHAFEVIKEKITRNDRIVCMCGKGNNGGDALVVARALLINQYTKLTVLLSDSPQKFTKDALTNYHILEKMGCSFKNSIDMDPLLEDSDVIIDGLLGIGIEGALRGKMLDIVQKINRKKQESGFIIFSLDTPSGFVVHNKILQGPCIKADHTITFLAPKRYMTDPLFTEYIGTISVQDIGISREFLQQHMQK